MYAAYGLAVRVPFPCPVLLETDAEPDVVVEDGLVPSRLDAPLAGDRTWEAEPERFLVRGGRRAGRFLVEGGTRVTLERTPIAEDGLLAFHLLHSVLAAVLRHRGLLVLHANAAVTPSGAVVIAGESGSGKSTALAALLARGCALLSDDVTALRPAAAGGVEVLPGVPHLHLTEESAAAVGQDISGLPRYPWRRTKATVPAHARMAGAPAPLHALYVLASHSGSDLRVSRLDGVEKFDAVRGCMYGPVLAGQHAGHFGPLAALAGEVTVVRAERPAGRWSVEELCEVFLQPAP
jgi:hypothetical protein